MDSWATGSIKECYWWREGMTPEEYDIEREYCYNNFEKVKSGEYKPLWKQAQ